MMMQITDFIQGRGEANHESILSGYLKQASASVAVFFWWCVECVSVYVNMLCACVHVVCCVCTCLFVCVVN